MTYTRRYTIVQQHRAHFFPVRGPVGVSQLAYNTLYKLSRAKNFRGFSHSIYKSAKINCYPQKYVLYAKFTLENYSLILQCRMEVSSALGTLHRLLGYMKYYRDNIALTVLYYCFSVLSFNIYGLVLYFILFYHHLRNSCLFLTCRILRQPIQQPTQLAITLVSLLQGPVDV